MAALVMQAHSQRGDDGGSPIHTPRKNSGHMPQPEEVCMTTREVCATLRDQETTKDNAAANDENKDYFSCSCPSAPLSSACSISSASGLSNSPVLSHSLAGQAITPLSMEGSECNVEGEPAIRKRSRPPTPFDALAGLLTLDKPVTSAPQDGLDETKESHEPAYNRPPTLPQAQPLDPPNTTARSHKPRDVCLPAESLGLARDICREDTDYSTRTGRLDEAGISTTDFDGTGRRPGFACANGCTCKCDDALDASQQPTAAAQAEDFGDTSGPMLAGSARPNQGKQLQLQKQQHCCPTEPAAAEPEPRSGCSGPAIPVNGENHALPSGAGDPGMAPTSFPRPPLNPVNPCGANTHHPCAPEHDVRRATKPSADGPDAAARDGKIVNTKRTSRNSSLTATASRDPPFSSSASPPSHLSSFVLSPSSLASIPASIEQSAQDNEEQFQPLVRRASDNSSLRIQHPIPDINPKTGALLGNIAQLEATAERLSSTTASIEDAIRDLHTELKRSDSQRSAAARARAGIQSAGHEADDGALASRLRRPALIKPPPSLVRRRTVHSGPTTTTQQPARYRPRSGSLNAGMQSSAGMDSYISRTGPGKGSVRSVRSGKQSLAEISESEPVGFTRAAFNDADRIDMTDGDDDTIRPHTGHDKTPKRESFIPSTDAFHAMLDPNRAPNSELFFDHPQTRAPHFLSVEEQRPVTSASNASSTHNSAFRDFDGVHCDPEVNFLPPSPQQLPMLDEHPPVPPQALRPESPPKPQPTSYVDNETGKEMLYYPARVPAMLSLPPKLSKKPKAAARNQRQSHMLSTMPEIARRSGASWLPDPLADTPEAPFLNPISLDTDDSFAAMTSQSPRPEDYGVDNTVHDETTTLDPKLATPEIHVNSTPADPAVDDDEVKPAVPRPRKDNAADVDARKSRLSKYNSNLPPQLRASVFFDLPSNSTKLEVKDGSAMATLDHLLDASTSAPVSAFTDHMIAGKLGSEVYGTEKRRPTAAKPQDSQQHLKESDAKKRGSLFHRVKKSEDFERNARSESGTSDSADDEVLPPGAVGYATLRPGSDELDDNDNPDGGKASDGENEDNEEYYGPPTTLLAELQMRKQEQKNRTRPINQAFPNGMHSTLLELDAVAEKQRKNRKGKRVNLAWEDPDPIAADAGSDDEDVPLGVLFAGKATGVNDIAELNRPMGLMERREMEENEPLSQRRARLQGHDPGHKRQTLIPNSATRMSANRLSQMPSLGNIPAHQRAVSPGNAEQEEVEGETLGERRRRLKKKEEEDLPQARPVSSDFSSELLGQFGGLKDEKKESEDGNAAGDGEEGEETLGQRRRRLQAEREGQGGRPAAHQASTSFSAPAKRLSMANILTAHPKRDTTSQDDERHKAQEALRFQRSQEEKLAALRSQMPTSLEKTSVGGAVGGFGNGRFNDGMGGTGRWASRKLDFPGVDPNRSSVVLGGGMIQQAGVNSMLGPGAGQYGGYSAPQQYNSAAGQYNGVPPAGGWYPQVQASMMPGQSQVPMQMMPMQMGAVPNQGQSDSIERWRQSVMPQGVGRWE